MPRYHFMFSDGTSVVEDPEATELPDLDAARREAAKDVKHLRQRRISGDRNWAGWAVQVTDESGAVLFRQPFSRASR